jgi:hypothetical protein
MPSNPKECLLEVGVKGQAYCTPTFGLLFFTFGLIFIIVGIMELLN